MRDKVQKDKLRFECNWMLLLLVMMMKKGRQRERAVTGARSESKKVFNVMKIWYKDIPLRYRFAPNLD